MKGGHGGVHQTVLGIRHAVVDSSVEGSRLMEWLKAISIVLALGLCAMLSLLWFWM